MKELSGLMRRGKMLSQEAVEEFKQIILEEQGIELTDQQAYQDAIAFLEAFKVLVADTTLIQKDRIDTKRTEHGNVS